MNIKDTTTLEKVVQSYKCDIDTLINLAAQGKFPVFIAANNWYAHVWRSLIPYRDLPEDSIQSDIDDEMVLNTTLQKPIQLNHAFLELKKSSLQAYLLKKPNDADIGAFEVDRETQWDDEYYFEYRLCNPSDFAKPHHIKLSQHTMIVRNCDLKIIEKLLLDTPILTNTDLTVTERKKLLKIIGALTLLISQSASKCNNNGKPNVSAISEKIEEMFTAMENAKQDVNYNGIKDSVRREVIAQGIAAIKKI